MSQIVRFRRPEAPESVCSMFVEGDASPAHHIRRMESLGYTVVDILPPPVEAAPARSEFPR